jgi:ubiquinone/menaquinone biosynthesis C-methylase UbiE
MNEHHLQFLASDDWARMLESELFPWVDRVADLGDDVLEVGPGPGLTTDLLRQRVGRVTAVEIDETLASALSDRLSGTNVEVINADASCTGLEADRFSAATCFSMLHHVPSVELQDRVFAELNRLLKPGASLVASDSLDNELIRQFHEDDVFVPLNPDTLGHRLEAAGFSEIRIELTEYEVRFAATGG